MIKLILLFSLKLKAGQSESRTAHDNFMKAHNESEERKKKKEKRLQEGRPKTPRTNEYLDQRAHELRTRAKSEYHSN